MQVLLPLNKTILHMGVLRQIAEYLYIKKKDPNAPTSQWMRYMHGINRISIFMFLAGVIVILVKFFFFKKH
jgi:hypothetical protein